MKLTEMMTKASAVKLGNQKNTKGKSNLTENGPAWVIHREVIKIAIKKQKRITRRCTETQVGYLQNTGKNIQGNQKKGKAGL